MLTEIISDPNYLRNKVLCGMALSVGIFCLFVITLNIYLQDYTLAFIELVLCLNCIFIYKQTKSHSINGWQLFLLPYFLLMVIIYATYTKGLHEGVFLWSYIIPTLFYLLYGIRHGFITAFIVAFVQTIIIVNKESSELYDTTIISINFFIAYLAVWVISHIYEKNRVQIQQTLSMHALTDPLTHLFNRLALRHFFTDRINHQLPVSVAIIDLDLFKRINDNYGHDAGDFVLCHFAQQLKDNLDKQQVYRIGGEEFALLMQATATDTHQILSKLLQQRQNEILQYNHHRIEFTFSAGISTTETGSTLTDLLKSADLKLYIAKNSGRNQIQ